MIRLVATLLLTLYFAERFAFADSTTFNAEQSSSRPMDGETIGAARQYSEGVGRQVLKDELGIDLNAIRFQFDPKTLRIEKVEEHEATGQERQEPRNRDLQAAPHTDIPTSAWIPDKLFLAIDQSGDLMRLRDDNRDIPFGVRFSGEIPLLDRVTALKTRIWVPFSWRDEIKASATVPLNKLNLGGVSHFFQKLNLSDRLDLRSDYTSRLGVNHVDAGLGTKWQSEFMGLMDLDYDYSQRYGQGLEETVHWLKLKKVF